MHPRKANLRKLAEFQRWLIGLVIAVIAGSILHITLVASGIVVQREIVEVISKLLTILMAFVIIITGWALGMSLISILLNAAFIFIPGLNVLAILFLNWEINSTFRKAGVRVGVFGANLADLELALDPALCRSCGYNLTANVTGRCPECGASAQPSNSMQEEME